MSWFRLYEELVHDPKVQRLPAETFKGLINLWCLTSINGGTLPAVEDVAYSLHLLPAKAKRLLADLRAAGLIDDEEGTTRPHNWNGRQFKSDVTDPTAAERMRRYRNKTRNSPNEPGRNGDGGHSVTPAVTETVTPTVTTPVTKAVTSRFPEAETEQNRAEAETESAAAQHFARGRNGSRNGTVTPEPDPRLNIPDFLDRVGAECREAAGLAPTPALADTAPIVALLDHGYDLARDVLPALRAAKAAGKRGRTWGYYVTIITETRAASGKVAPKQELAEGPLPTWIVQDDPRWRGAEAAWRLLHGKAPPHVAGLGGMGWHFPAEVMALTQKEEPPRDP